MTPTCRNFVGLVVLTASLVALCPSAFAQADRAQGKAAPVGIDPGVVERVTPSVAFVDTKSGSGSGFLVLPNVIATCAHVIRDEAIDDVSVRFASRLGPGAKPLKPQLLYDDKARDLALLLIPPQTDRAPLQLMTAFAPGPGKTVFVVGNPGQGGRLARVNAVGVGSAEEIVMFAGQQCIQLKVSPGTEAIDVGPGTSGGPVFDPAGNVVGILAAGQVVKGRPTGKCFSVPAAALAAALDGLGDESKWADKVRAVAACHLLDTAIINYYLSGQVAALFLKLRHANAERLTRVNQADVVAVNRKLIASLRPYDKTLSELAEPAYRGALDKQEWSPALRQDLMTLRANTSQIRRYVLQERLPAGEMKHCNYLIDQSDAPFTRLKKATGLTDELINEMKGALLDKVNAKIDR